MSSGGALASWLVPVLVVPVGVVGLWAAVTYCTGRHSVENAPYKVLRVLSSSSSGPGGRGGRVTLRAYPASLQAAVDVVGEPDLGRAQSRGFRAVAGYIFGANVAAAGTGAASETVAMTSPVLSQALSVPVAMTAPVVTQALAGDAASPAAAAASGGFRVALIMPSKYTRLESLPVPTNPAVRLLAVPPRLELVESRTGLYPDAAARDAAAERLAAVAQREGLRVTLGVAPSVANFDPPWSLPWMRLSEVAVRVDDDRVGASHEDK